MEESIFVQESQVLLTEKSNILNWFLKNRQLFHKVLRGGGHLTKKKNKKRGKKEKQCVQDTER